MERKLTAIEQKLIDLGERIWEKGDKCRIYLNNSDSFKEFFGFEFGLYNTGRVCWAKLYGEKISNREAYEILKEKHYFDCNTQTFQSSLELI